MLTDFLQRHPFLRLLMPLVVGILCGDAFPHVVSLWACAAVLPLLLAFFVFCRSYRFRWLFGLAVYTFFLSLGWSLAGRQSEKADFAYSGNSSVYKVRLQQEPEMKERSILCRVSVAGEFGRDTSFTACSDKIFLLYFPKDSLASALRRGDELLVYTRLSPPVNSGNPCEFDYAGYLRHKGVAGTAYVADGNWRLTGHDDTRTFGQKALDCREKIVNLYRGLGIGGDELAVLSALTVGDKEELSEDIVETYSVAGASHVLALSGLHIGFLYALFLLLLAPLWKRCRCLKPFLVLLIILLLWGFAFLTGLSSSVVRSVIMFSLLALSGLQPEKPLTLNTLAVTAFLMLLWRPFWLFDVGFQLSFAAVASILTIRPAIYSICKFENRFLRYGWGLVAISVAAQIGTAPLVIFYFSRFSTHFLLTNLWVIPMTSLILYSGVFLLLLTPFPWLQQMFSGIVRGLVHIQNSVLRQIEQLPLASFDGLWMDRGEVLLYFLLLVLTVICLKRRTVRCSYLVLVVLFSGVSYHYVSAMLRAPRRSIQFYNVRGCPAVHCMTDGSESWLASADSMPQTSRLTRVLSPYWNSLRLKPPQWIGGEFSSKSLSYRNGILCYAGRRVVFLHDARWRNKTSGHPLVVDYLYVSKGYEGGINELTSLFSVGTVILDASLPARFHEKIVNDCILLGIPRLSLSEKGTVRILL